ERGYAGGDVVAAVAGLDDQPFLLEGMQHARQGRFWQAGVPVQAVERGGCVAVQGAQQKHGALNGVDGNRALHGPRLSSLSIRPSTSVIVRSHCADRRGSWVTSSTAQPTSRLKRRK